MQVKVISIVQPWASLIVSGHKRVETRSWDTRHRGPLYIHASLKKAKQNEEIYTGLCQQFNITDLPAYNELPFGSIIGSGFLDDTFQFGSLKSMEWLHRNPAEARLKECAMGDWEEGRWGWGFIRPQQLQTPVPVRGKLSIWSYDLKIS